MRKSAIVIIVSMLVALLPLPALARCSGHADSNIGLAREFADSRWVVRAKVVTADHGRSAEGPPWTLYRLQVLKTYKGAQRRRLSLFAYDGGFRLGRDKAHNIGGTYLLFLRPLAMTMELPGRAAGALEVGHVCGQSKEWTKVAKTERRRLDGLTRRR